MTDERPLKQMVYDVLPDRMPEIPADQLTDRQKEVIAALSASRGGVRGSFVALARCPELMDRVQQLGAYIRFGATLDLRVNRVASLLTSRHWTSQYEWSGNTGLALEAGLRQEIIDAIGEGRRPDNMAKDEETAYDFVTEALTNKSVSDPTYARAKAMFGEEGVIDLLGIMGYYALLALVMNVVRTPVPAGKPLLTPFPQGMKPLS